MLISCKVHEHEKLVLKTFTIKFPIILIFSFIFIFLYFYNILINFWVIRRKAAVFKSPQLYRKEITQVIWKQQVSVSLNCLRLFLLKGRIHDGCLSRRFSKKIQASTTNFSSEIFEFLKIAIIKNKRTTLALICHKVASRGTAASLLSLLSS